ncbi:hypothetical protein [Sphingomonas lycopersici]|uniref:Cytochrome c n=1 Tax=Sphingomonas lycopersici TaxID=2951807 RepID=A0AA42CNI6_9SPHN|nr:hypothetical protein [Sphingomonas lycopersici]MCW6533374.1 hypothetical protein [Sphingomonas lycopersici]
MTHKTTSLASLLTGIALTGTIASAAPQSPPPPGPGLNLINERCGFCHSTAQVFAAHKAPAAWAGVVQSMIDRGAELSPEEQKTVVDYLAAHYSDGNPAPAADASPQPAKH